MMPPHNSWHAAGTWCMGTANGMPVSSLLVVGQCLGPWGVLPVSSGDPASSSSLCSLVAIRRPELAVEATGTKLPPAQGTTGGWPLWEAGLQLWAFVSLEIGQSPRWEVKVVISELLVVGKQVLGGREWVLSSLFPLPPSLIGCPLCPPRQFKTRT